MNEKKRPIYSPSLMCADRLNLKSDLDELVANGVEFLHYDVADGHSVDAICLDPELLKSVREAYPKAVLDVHVMVEKPERYFELLQSYGADYLTVSSKEVESVSSYEKIRALGIKPALMIEPDVSVSAIESILPLVDMVVVMSITPGKKGIPFDENAYAKIDKLATLRKERGYNYLISVDGGVDERNGKKCVDMGVDVLVVGYFAFFKKGRSITDSYREFVGYIEKR